MQEIWEKLVYPNIPDDLNRFEISTYGRLRNKITHHIYKLDVLSSGYCSVRTTLGSRNNKIHILIHKAVAYTFLNNKDNLPEINHKDGNKTNNYIGNLEWCTSSENMLHAYRTGLEIGTKGYDHPESKLTESDVKFIKEHYIPRDKIYGARALGKMFGVSHSTISKIINSLSYLNVN